MSQVKAISVTQLARRIRNLLEIEVGDIWVEGEISNVRKQGSGHWYFSLKDESAQISCAMFGARSRQGNEVIADGAQVQIFGETSFYEARGSTQLIVKKAQAVGVGDLQARFEALKRKLDQEGLFSQERKRPLPGFPRVLGIVTSPTGAALQDMKNVLSRRAPWLTVVLFPAAVQGKGAERGIAQAIRRAGKAAEEGLPQPEVLIVARGGGSLEDLWNFNEEVVARAIAASTVPVISAVGHEIDFTISDFVADLRAPTPSAAAELVVPDRKDLLDRLESLGARLSRVVRGRIDRLSDQLDYYERGGNQSSERKLQQPLLRLKGLRRDFSNAIEESVRVRERLIHDYQANWNRYHPREMLKR
ncbi:MAG: exodeoxyribonuclease VII large subunit, partial [Akkermansiaceae bacterium]